MITLEPYQQDAVDWLSRTKRGMVISPAGSGKTIIAAAALDRTLGLRKRQEPVKIGWIANTVEQCAQAHKAIENFPAVKECNVAVACAAAGRSWRGFDALVVDECHHVARGASWRQQVESCDGARWGFTATPWTDDEAANKTLLDAFGASTHEISRDLVKNRLVAAHVRLLHASDPDAGDRIDAEIVRIKPIRMRQFARSNLTPGQIHAMVVWEACCREGIAGNVARTEEAVRIAEECVDNGRRLLILVNGVEHAEEIAETLGDWAQACVSKMGKPRRKKALADFSSGKLSALVATSLADEGLDLPCADTLILVSGGKSWTKAEQRTGRVLRTFAGKQRGLIYDFSDRFHRTMERHAQERQALYRELGYVIDGEFGLE